MGIYESAAHASTVTLEQFQGREDNNRQPAFNVMHSTEVLAHVSSSGFNTSHGGTITASMRNVGTGTSTYATRAFVFLQADAILELGLDNAAVLS